MFSDKRINNQISKVFSKAILYATIIGALHLAIKFIIMGFIFVNVIPELFITISGLAILIKDFNRFNGETKDERIEEERMVFYKNNSKIFLGLSLLGFAIAIPLQSLSKQEAPPVNLLIINLQVVGFIYFNYQFKKERIFYNYTFIEKESGYYKNVFNNILKLVVLVTLVYVISIILAIVLLLVYSEMIAVFIGIIIAWIISALILSLIYLFISWMERLTYLSLVKGQKYLSSQMIIGGIFLIVFIIISYLKYHISTFDPTSMTNAIQYLNILINVSNELTLVSDLLLSMLLTNILMQFKEKVKGVNIMIFIMIITILLSFFTNYLLGIGVVSIIFISVDRYVNLILRILQMIGLFILTLSLIRKNMSVLRMAIPIISIILVFLNLDFPSYSSDTKLIIIIVVEIIFSVLYVVNLTSIKNDDAVLLNS